MAVKQIALSTTNLQYLGAENEGSKFPLEVQSVLFVFEGSISAAFQIKYVIQANS